MSAKTVVIVVLVCATGAAVYLLRSHSADRLVASDVPESLADVRDGARPDLEVEQPEPAEAADSSASSSSNGAPFASAPGEPPVIFEHQVAPTPISRALDDLKFPPMPELLEAERAFAAEGTDRLWAAAMEGRILGEIARTTDLQLVTLQVECRTRMCRLQLVERRFQDAESRIVFPAVANGPRLSGGPIALFADLVSSLDLDPRWVASVVDGNGTPTSLAYLARRDSVDSPRSR